MMKVYQPLCPDITFRLAADLSPHDSEDSTASSPSSSSSSSSSSEAEEEAKVERYGEGEEGGEDKRSTCPTGAHPLPCSNNNTTHIYSQQPANAHLHTTTPSSASATSPSPSQKHREDRPLSNLPQGNRELNSNLFTEHSTATPTQPSLPQASSQLSAHGTTTTLARGPAVAHGTTAPAHGTTAPAQGSKRRADDSLSCALAPRAVEGGRCFRQREVGEAGGGDNVSDDDSVEDVSISHNVPMSSPSPSPLTPSSSASPRERVVVGVSEEERGSGASGSWSESDHGGTNTTSDLRLGAHRRSHYQGPYTLACDVTPSPRKEQVTLASSLARPGYHVSGHVTAAATTTPTTATPSAGHSGQLKVPRRPRKLPEIPRKHQGLATSSSHVRSIFDEIQEALIREATADPVFSSPPPSSSSSQERAAQQYPYIHKHLAHLFDKKRLLIGYASSGPAPSASRSRHNSVTSCSGRDVSTCSQGSEAAAAASVGEGEEERERRGEVSVASCRDPHLPSPSTASFCSSPSSLSSSATVPLTCPQSPRRRRRDSEEEEGSRRRRQPSGSSLSAVYQEMEVTHRGMHRFIPRHADELHIGIGDPIHVIRQYDDLWCEGVNLRSGERGIFPAMYANDLTFLEDSDGDEEHWKFTMRFLGAVEVTSSSGDFALCQAINKVAQQGKAKTSSLCTLEINQYGIRMIDKSKEGHQSQKFTNFFALKNISFCGTHPNNNRYFAFITKHPREMRFACHVFHSDRTTHRARDALGNAFRRFYQEYMAFTHPTEDIWME